MEGGEAVTNRSQPINPPLYKYSEPPPQPAERQLAPGVALKLDPKSLKYKERSGRYKLFSTLELGGD